MSFTSALRTSVRPIVTYALTAAGIGAALHFGNPEFIYATAGPVIGFWFADRAKEREQQSLAYGAAQDRSMAAANSANIDLIRAQREVAVPPAPVVADATKSKTMGFPTG